jgi:hypothetical protein
MDYLSYDYEITIAVLSPTRKVHAPSKKRSRPPLGPAFHQNDSLEPVASHTFPFTFPAAGVAMPEILSVLLSMVDLHKMGESSGCFIAS